MFSTFLLEKLCGIYMNAIVLPHIHLANYEVEYMNEANSMLIIIGFVLFVISEISLAGKDLKEEQELTI